MIFHQVPCNYDYSLREWFWDGVGLWFVTRFWQKKKKSKSVLSEERARGVGNKSDKGNFFFFSVMWYVNLLKVTKPTCYIVRVHPVISQVVCALSLHI